MDHSWRPHPTIQGNICPTCSISHFPFCPPLPHPSTYSAPNLDPNFRPINMNRPVYNNTNPCDPYYDPGYSNRNPSFPHVGNFGTVNGGPYSMENPGFGDGSYMGNDYYNNVNGRGIKRLRVDGNYPGLYGVQGDGNYPASKIPVEGGERRLKMIHDHGGPNPGFGFGGDMRGNALESSGFDRNVDVRVPGNSSEFGVRPLSNVEMSNNPAGVGHEVHYQRDGVECQTGYGSRYSVKRSVSDIEHGYHHSNYGMLRGSNEGFYGSNVEPLHSHNAPIHYDQRSNLPTANHYSSGHPPLPPAVPQPGQLRYDYGPPRPLSDLRPPIETRPPPPDGCQVPAGNHIAPARPHYGAPHMDYQGGYGNSIPENTGHFHASQGFDMQPPLPASPPPPLPMEPPGPWPADHKPLSPPPRVSSSLFPVPVGSSAPVHSSHVPIPESHTRANSHLLNSQLGHMSRGAFQRDAQGTLTSFGQYLGDGQTIPSKNNFPDKPKTIDAAHLFKPPHRKSRPDHFVIILRGLPGSGKSYLAKMLRDLEVEHGGSAPRIHSMDDYFMTEVEKVEENEASKSSGRFKKPTMKMVLEYCYEPEMEEAYRSSMLKAFKKTLEEGAFTFVIVDDRNLRVADFAQFWATAKRSGYEVYVLEAPYKDPAGCTARNIHGFNQVDVEKMAAKWEEAPSMYLQVDAKSLFHGDDLKESNIEEVDMDTEDGDVDERVAEKIVTSSSGDFGSYVSQKDERNWNSQVDHPAEEVKDLGRSKWSDNLDAGSGSTTDQKRIPKSKHNSSMPNNDTIPPMPYDELDKIGKDATFEKSVQDQGMKFSNQRMNLSHKVSDSDDNNLHSHHQVSSTGSAISDPLRKKKEKKEMGANPIYEAFQQANDLELECKANKHEGILYDKQKNSSMWHLIYQHVKSAGVSETGNKLSERLTGEDQVNRSGTSSDADADADDSDASSVTSELTESDAIKLVKEAINDILNVPQDVEDELTPSNKTTTSEGQSIEVEENPKKSLSRGYSKLRKIIICNKFIKAMEKTRNFYPQTSRTLNSGSEPRNSHLTNCAVGERKGMDEWMLDNVLQKVIAGLAPVQQKRVSLLVKAFEKVNPDPEERAKRLIYTKTEFPDTSSSEGNTKEMEKAVPSDSSHNSELPGDIHLKLDRSQNSSSEVVTERVLQESCKDESPGLTRECALNGQSCSSGDPSDINAATSDPISNLSETNKDPTEIDATNAPGVPPEERKNSKDEAGAQVEEKTLLEEQEVENTELTAKSSKKPPQPEDLEDEWNYSVQNSRSLEKPTGLWGLILQHVSVDMLEKNESPKTIQIDANVQVGSSSTEVSDSKTDDSSQLSSRVKSCRDMGVQTPTSFEFEENEAIKLVEEAVEEILLLQDQICDTESITSGITSEKGVYGENKGEAIDPSLAATEIAGVATSLNTDATLEEKKTSSEENVPTSYSTLSKVVMCRRFVKAMNKMRKLKALHVQDLSQPPQSQGEGNPSLRQISTRDKASWEEGMLDNALQKVIGNLAPAKKQRVALLVQAFETVGSLPEPTNSWRGKASVL